MTSNGVHGRNVLTRSDLLFTNSEINNETFQANVLHGMSNDLVTKTVITDPLIIQFGKCLFKVANKKHSINYVRQRMQQTARFLILMKDVDPNVTKLQDVLKPEMFDKVVAAVKQCSNFNEDDNMYGLAGLPPKIGYNIDKYCAILNSNSIKINNEELKHVTETFCSLSGTIGGKKSLPKQTSH